MRVIRLPRWMAELSEQARMGGARIALVPTMGFLHEGHLSLMGEGRRRASLLVASVFVNPAQFGPNEDFSRYPRALDRDLELMSEAGVDVVFAPQAADMYLPGAQTWVEVTGLTRGLCGRSRPGHFRGVTTVVAKLFNIVKPHLALFGEKDFQQLRAIERMVADLDFDIEIVAMPIVREPDGLAMSSRNAYLVSDERQQALALSRALRAARETYERGAPDLEQVVQAARLVLSAAPRLEVDYVEAVDAATLEPARTLERPVLLAIAARVGSTRLIDNTVLARRVAAGGAGEEL